MRQKDVRGGPGLEGVEPRQYRSVAMRINYLAADRPELQYSAKELARCMQEPTAAGWEAVKRTARFLLGHPREVWTWRRQDMRRYLSGYSDSDYAGQSLTRKSTSCTVEMLGEHLLGQSSTT